MTEDDKVTVLEVTGIEKDLGVLVDDKLKFQPHTNTAVNKGNRMLGIIRRSFQHLDRHNMTHLYKSLVRPVLEYGNTIWNPHYKQDVDAIEAVQRRATKLIPDLKELSYPERLKQLHLPTLAHRRRRGDMINVYKYLHNQYTTKHPFHLAEHRGTRGHELKLQKQHCRLDIRKFFFSNRVVDLWNSLPSHAVLAPTLNSFKNRLDKH
jgi:hypothetical protein